MRTLLALSLLLAGCTTTVHATQVTVVVDADAEVRARSVRVEVDVFDEDRALLESTSLDEPFPHELVAYRVDEAAFYMVVTAVDGSGALVARDVVAVRFAEGESKQVERVLTPSAASCGDCASDERCDASGGCVATEVIDASTLPDRPIPGDA